MNTTGVIEKLNDEIGILWSIPNYFSHQKADSCFNSPEFHMLGSTWNIRLYPNGQRKYKSVELVGLQINLIKKYKDQDILFKIGIVCGEGLIYEKTCCVSNGCNFTAFAKFMERRILTANKLLVAPEGALTVKLVGRPLHDAFDKANQTKLLDGMNALTRDFRNLLISEQESDLEIRVKSRVFRAHRLVLQARSSVFAAMFRYDMKEKITGSVDIEDCDPSAFQEFLTFMYTGKINNLSSENVSDIFFLASKYDLSDLKQMCIDFMEENLCLNMVWDVLAIADKFSLVDLKISAKELFLKHLKSLMTTEDWISFLREHPALATEILMDAVP